MTHCLLLPHGISLQIRKQRKRGSRRGCTPPAVGDTLTSFRCRLIKGMLRQVFRQAITEAQLASDTAPFEVAPSICPTITFRAPPPSYRSPLPSMESCLQMKPLDLIPVVHACSVGLPITFSPRAILYYKK